MSSSPGHSSLSPVQPGERLAGRYVVERVVGTGGMGVVVAARHEQLGRTVAIKILTISTELHPEAVERFLREARAAASLRSEHIARVMDVGTDERGRHFIVMEHLEGEDLGAMVRRDDPLTVGQAVGYVLQACEALAEAHNQGIIHRDLKPENIFLTRRVDGSPLIKVLDFGISKMTSHSAERNPASLSASGPRSLLGSPLYMSPEQIRTPSNIDPRSDVWALGVILFELLTGRRPFQGQSLPDILAAILTRVPPGLLTLRHDAPPALADVVASCLEKDVDKRMGSVGQLAQSLQEWAPRWARDSAARAARMSGIATQITGSQDLDAVLNDALNNVPATAEDTPRPAEKRENAEQGDRAPQPNNRAQPAERNRKHKIAAVALIAGVACAVLAAGAWRINHAPRFNSEAARSVPSSAAAPALVQTAESPLAAAPALPPVGDDPAKPDALHATATKDTAAPAAREVAAAPPAMKTLRTIRRRVTPSLNRHPSPKEAAAPLDPLEGRK
ncbi:MAG: serine/threonine-protein kinase [Myxococcales bacterium]